MQSGSLNRAKFILNLYRHYCDNGTDDYGGGQSILYSVIVYYFSLVLELEILAKPSKFDI